MWIVAKLNNNFKIFKKNFLNKNNDVKFYNPLIIIKKKKFNKIVDYESQLLNKYIFCYHQKFADKEYISKFKFIPGLDFFLPGYEIAQDEINNFIDNCKKSENEKGYLKNSFLRNYDFRKGKFLNGPFANMFFEIIEKQKNKIKIKVSNKVAFVEDSKEYFYQPI